MFGAGLGPIHLDDVFCVGFEDRLIDCPYDSNTADCLHFEDAGVRCRRKCTDSGLKVSSEQKILKPYFDPLVLVLALPVVHGCRCLQI